MLCKLKTQKARSERLTITVIMFCRIKKSKGKLRTFRKSRSYSAAR